MSEIAPAADASKHPWLVLLVSPFLLLACLILVDCAVLLISLAERRSRGPLCSIKRHREGYMALDALLSRKAGICGANRWPTHENPARVRWGGRGLASPHDACE
jgi:hypothetical protein